MPEFMVTGADADSAEDRAIRVKAIDAESASEQAAAMGMLVHRVYPLARDGVVHRTQEAFDELADRGEELLTLRPPTHKPARARRIALRMRDIVAVCIGVAVTITAVQLAMIAAGTGLVAWNASAPIPAFLPRELAVTGTPTAPQSVVAMRPLEAGDGPAHPVRIKSSRMQAVGLADSSARAAWTLGISNDSAHDYTLRITPALLGHDGDRVWFGGQGVEIHVPPGDWTFRKIYTVSDQAWANAEVTGYYRW